MFNHIKCQITLYMYRVGHNKKYPVKMETMWCTLKGNTNNKTRGGRKKLLNVDLIK